jgi:rod shape-determining protein MreD
MLYARAAAVRWMGIGVLLFLAVVLQTMVFPRISVMPNAMLSIVAVVSFAVFSGLPGGAAAGFICGLLCDAIYGTEAYFALSAMGAGALSGALCGKVLQRAFLPALALSAVSVAVIKGLYILFFQTAARGIPVSSFISVGLPVFLASIISVPLVYPLFRAVAKHSAEE